MKIAILTQPLHTNYGGILQNYALQQTLKQMGHEVETINWIQYIKNPFKDWLWIKKRTILSYFKKDVEKPHNYKLSKKELKTINRNTQFFCEHNITLSPFVVKCPKMFRELENRYKYDAYIVGSDQVWRPRYNTMLTSMFLDFVERDNVKRIAYAASFGTSDWEFDTEMTTICSQLARKFDLISVREKSGIGLCRKYLETDAILALDPTLLLHRKQYEMLAEKEPQSQGTLFSYILDPDENKQRLVNDIAGQLDLTPFGIMPNHPAERRTRKDVKEHIDECIYPPVTRWIRGFMDAKMVVTDSFHGVLFSIIFNKPFWVMDNTLRGNARFDSLLDLFGLEERRISDISIPDKKWDIPIDWNKINLINEREVKKSLSLLQNAIQTGDKQ